MEYDGKVNLKRSNAFHGCHPSCNHEHHHHTCESHVVHDRGNVHVTPDRPEPPADLESHQKSNLNNIDDEPYVPFYANNTKFPDYVTDPIDGLVNSAKNAAHYAADIAKKAKDILFSE
uniref:Superoxide dismutase n=1 Tax=Rhabditophanes sp. KR3021 TaxID=114890 RepID=A0AC35TFY3_9BILA